MPRTKNTKAGRPKPRPETRASRRLKERPQREATGYDSEIEETAGGRQHNGNTKPKKVPVSRRQFRLASSTTTQSHDQPSDNIRKQSIFSHYLADDEDEPDTRRFSDIHGPSRPLDETLMHGGLGAGDNPASPSKRKASESISTPSPKKVRFDRGSNETRIAQEGSTSSLPVSPTIKLEPLDQFPELPEAYELQLSNLVSEPKPLQLQGIANLTTELRSQAKVFAKAWFGKPEKYFPAARMPMKGTFPIHDLQHKYPALYYSTVYLLDASTTNGEKPGWVDFYEKPELRTYLVNAVIGEWFTQRIFKDSAFGLNAAARAKFEEIDKQYIHFDSFIRAKKRAALLSTFVAQGLDDVALYEASQQLADELMMLLEPLTAKFESECLHEEVSFARELIENLTTLISRAAALHLSIILSGHDGTVIRMAPTMLKGRAWQSTMPMTPINGHITKSKPSNMQDAELTVRMVCWPRVEAYRPHGPDLEEMAAKQRQAILNQTYLEEDLESATTKIVASMIKQRKSSGASLSTEDLDAALVNARRRKFCWDCSTVKSEFPEVPLELHHQWDQQRKKQEQKIKMYDVRRKIDREEVRKAKESRRREDHDSDPSDSDVPMDDVSSNDSESDSDRYEEPVRQGRRMPQQQQEEEPPRGSYVDIFTCIVPHTVYLEWTEPEPKFQRNDKDTHKTLRQLNSLDSIITKARAEVKHGNAKYYAGKHVSSFRVRYEDAQLRLWKLYAANNLKIEYFALLAAVITCIGRGNPLKGVEKIGRSIIGLVLGSANLAGAIVKGTSSAGLFALTQVHDALHEAVEKIFGVHLPRPEVSELIERAHHAVHEGLDTLKDCWADIFHALMQILPRPELPADITGDATPANVRTLITPTSIEQISPPTSAASASAAAGVAGFFSSILYGRAAATTALQTGPVITMPQVTPAATLGPATVADIIKESTTRGGWCFKRRADDVHAVADGIVDDFVLPNL